SRHRPAADQEKQEQPGRVSLVIGNLGPTGLELAVDDAALGTVPAYETRTFPLTRASTPCWCRAPDTAASSDASQQPTAPPSEWPTTFPGSAVPRRKRFRP